MHVEHLSDYTHEHVFDQTSEAAERGTRMVVWITAAMMVVEIIAGWWFNSMALLADGWHMSSHALAIGLSAFAYAMARRYARDTRFAFGTWKIEVLGGFASAILLLGVAAMMVWSSFERILAPRPIHYQEAMVVAVLGLIVNAVCALILGKAHHHHDHDDHHSHDHAHAHEHEHEHEHDHDHGHEAHGHHDLNLRSAYLHVIADAATSVLAIIALAGGLIFGWSWLDPVMGIIGAVLVAIWAKGLLVQTGRVLLDREMDHAVVQEIREVIEVPNDPAETRITDLHVWRVGKRAYSCAIALVTHDRSLDAEQVRKRLSIHEEIAHSTIEIHHCAE